MVIGNGLMATTFSNFKNLENILVFASGVSNSTETNPKEFDREISLLKSTIKKHKHAKVIYFSTLSILDETVKQRPYISHKLKAEAIIQQETSNFLIARISNVVGSQGNKNTIINHLVHSVENEIPIEIWALAERNLIDQEDVKFLINQLLKNDKRGIVTIASEKSILMPKIISEVEFHLKKKAISKTIEKGSKLNIDTSQISEYLLFIQEQKGVGVKYLKYLLNKYY